MDEVCDKGSGELGVPPFPAGGSGSPALGSQLRSTGRGGASPASSRGGQWAPHLDDDDGISSQASHGSNGGGRGHGAGSSAPSPALQRGLQLVAAPAPAVAAAGLRAAQPTHALPAPILRGLAGLRPPAAALTAPPGMLVSGSQPPQPRAGYAPYLGAARTYEPGAGAAALPPRGVQPRPVGVGHPLGRLSAALMAARFGHAQRGAR